MKIKDLSPNPDNPRTITDAKLQMLKAALEEFGDLGGFVYNRKTKRLVGGHQRAKLFDATAEVVIEKKYAKATRTGTVAEGYAVLKGERFKYREVLWDEIKEKAANIAANKGAGEWDMPKLGEWLQALGDFGFDLNLTMFDDLERKGFLAADTKAGLTDDDEIPEKVETRSKLGDLWLLGEHRLLCGDSTNVQHVERLMAGEKADMVFTDPPYGINNDSAKGATYNNNKAYDDSKTFDLKLLPLEKCDWVIWGGNYYDWIPAKRTEIGWVVWDKRPTRETWSEDTRKAADRRFGQHFEIAITNIKGVRGKMIRKTWGGFYGTAGNKEDEIVHRTQKPVELLIHFAADKHKTILDLFLGSGSTLIACEKTNRRCFGMEIDPHYVDVIVTRWEAFTGKKAKLATHAKTQAKVKRSGK